MANSINPKTVSEMFPLSNRSDSVFLVKKIKFYLSSNLHEIVIANFKILQKCSNQDDEKRKVEFGIHNRRVCNNSKSYKFNNKIK